MLALPGGADPDKFLKEKGAEAYKKVLRDSPPYLNYLIDRARSRDRSTPGGKLATLNYLMPYVQRVPNRLMRSEWASRIASELRIEEPVLREALRRAAAERRSEVKPKAELVAAPVNQAERRLMQMLIEADAFREKLAKEMIEAGLHRGLESEKIFEALLAAANSGAPPSPAALAESLDAADRRILFDILFESGAAPSWDEAESCLSVMRRRRVEVELATVQRDIEAQPSADDLRRLLGRKQELRRILSGPSA